MPLIKLSESTAGRRTIRVLLLDISSNEPVTGQATAMNSGARLTQGDGTSGAVAGTFSEIDSSNDKGWYSYAATSGEVGAIGVGKVSYYDASNGYLLVDGLFQVVSFDPYDATMLGLTNVASPTNITAGTITTVSGNIEGDLAGDALGNLGGSVGGSILGDLLGNVIGTVGGVDSDVTVGTNNDKTGYSISGVITTLDGLNDFDPTTDVVAHVTLVDTTTNLTNGVSVSGTVDANVVSVEGSQIAHTGGFLDVVLTAGNITGTVSSNVIQWNSVNVDNLPSNFTDLAIDGEGLVTANNVPSASDIANEVLNVSNASVDGVTTSVIDMLRLVARMANADISIVGTTMTVTDADGTIATFTLNSSNNPSSRVKQ